MLLLDTQVALWLLRGTGRIGVQARSRIEAAPLVHVSAATVVEATIKSMIGRLRVPQDFASRLAGQSLLELPITNAHADAMRNFPELVRHDPFDRLLVAQAYVSDMDFLTADRRLLELGRDFIVDARV
jgi:PIN domain nuclease of toxin-antitoxin system